MNDPTSVVGRRILAYIVDALILGAVFLIMFATNAEFEDNADENYCDRIEAQVSVCVQSDETAWYIEESSQVATVFGVSFGSAFVYLVLLQGFTGVTLGKLMAGVRVVKEDGRPPGVGRALVRWLLLVIVDWFPYFLPITGFVTSLATQRHQRVGDLVAKTFVVRQEAAGRPLDGSGPMAPDPAWPSVTGPAYPTVPGSSFPTTPPPPPPGFGTPPPPPPPQ